MNETTTAWIALGLVAVGIGAAFGWRTIAHRRATGSSGFRGISGRPLSPEWIGGVLFAVAVVALITGVVLAALGIVAGPDVPLAVEIVGAVAALAGLAVVLAAQRDMGDSWRVGVDERERTDLVGRGLFGVVRNPVFSGMGLFVAGVTAAVPTPLTIGALVAFVVAIHLQVRSVEEPYLRRVHPDTYPAYARRVGRFVPGLGRLR